MVATTTQARHQQQHMFEGDFSTIQVGQRVQISEVRMHKLQGRYPEVATYPEVDIKLLEHGDTDPMYLTLAVFGLDETSGNGLLYDEALINALETQMKTDAIGGLQGHLGVFNGGDYPVEEGYWVGHLRDERGITWAKAYIPPGAFKEHIRLKKAQGGTVGTSIYALGVPEVVDEATGTWRIKVDDSDLPFELITLDFVHPKRAALPMARHNGGMELTSETENIHQTLNKSKEAAMPEEKKGTEEQAALRTPPRATEPDEVVSMRNNFQEQISDLTVELAEAKGQLRQITSIRKALGISEDEDVVGAVRLLNLSVQNLSEENSKLLEATVHALVAEKVRMESARPIIIEMVSAKKPATREDVQSVIDNILALEHVKVLLRTAVAAEMGPKQERPLTAATEVSGFWFEIPEVN